MLSYIRAASLAAVAPCLVAGAAILVADNAFGATVYPNTAISGPSLVLPQIDLEPDYPHVVLPDPVMITPSGVESLDSLVRANASDGIDDSEIRCLATAVYFESKGEPLAGQLAVARVIMNRAQSGRFAATLCGVIKQRSQFSFVRRGSLPAVRTNAQWRDAVGVSQVAIKGLHKGPAADALYFHARGVSPGWGKRAIASVGNHVFYR